MPEALTDILYNPYLRYSTFIAGAGVLLMLLARLLPDRNRDLSPRSPGPLLFHLTMVAAVLVLNVLIILSFKKLIDTAVYVQLARNLAHFDLNSTIAQTTLLDHYPGQNADYLSRGYTTVILIYGLLYSLIPSAFWFMTIQGALEIIVVFLSGWLLARELAARSGDRFSAFLFLASYDFCFITLYLALKDVNSFTYSLLGITLFALAALKRQRAMLWLMFFLTLSTRDLHLPLLSLLAVYFAMRGMISRRTAIALILSGIAFVILVYFVLYPVLGQQWLLFKEGKHLATTGLFPSVWSLGLALLICVAISGGAVLADWKWGVVLTLGLLVPFFFGRTGDWYEFYGGYIRFCWPVPFLALLTRFIDRPDQARRMVIASLACNLFFTYMYGPLPLTRIYAHRKSPLNLEPYSPAANHPSYQAIVKLIPPEVPVEASMEILPWLGDRKFAYQLVYYQARNVNREEHPPEYAVFDAFSQDLLIYPPEFRAREYDYLRQLIRNGGYGVIRYQDAVAVLQRGVTGDPFANQRFLADLSVLQQLPVGALHRAVAANQFNQPEILAAWRKEYGFTSP